eukprot:TRINITY_DN12138_c0_g1_i1.p1 TRINITY_DN12138_c0_g1~~TRINITY_DN12138_c0_g1_i1.p1  ORF type:complete len:781 (+),score=246.73 TRINITY_DN12138_c0_g1_i1:1616-3958(+)
MRAVVLGVDAAAGDAAADALRATAWEVTYAPCPKDQVAATVREVAAHAHPDAVLVVGGCGLSSGDTVPEQVRDMCGGRLLGGLCEVAYEAGGMEEYGLRRGIAGVAGAAIVVCCPVRNAGPAALALAGVLPEFVAELRRSTPSTLPVPPRAVQVRAAVVEEGLKGTAEAAAAGCASGLARAGIAVDAAVPIEMCISAAWLRGHAADVLKSRGGSGTDYPDVLVVIGGDGLTVDASCDSPAAIRELCGRVTLPGLAEVGYAAAGAAAAGLSRGVAGLCRGSSGNALLVLNCPSMNAGAAGAALAPVVVEFLKHARGEGGASAPPGPAPPAPSLAAVPTAVVGRARKSKYVMMEMDEALRCIEALAPPPRQAVAVPVNDASLLGLVAAKPVTAAIAHPPFPAAIKDGYAIRAAAAPGDFEVLPFAATAGGDAAKVQDAFSAGGFGGKVAVRVSTGGAVPRGADAVVQIEDTDLLEADAAKDVEKAVRVRVAARAGQDIRAVGSDIKVGAELVPVGQEMTPAEIGLVASGGFRSVEVHPRPRVAVMSSGDELCDAGAGDGPGFGQIYDSNRHTLLAAVKAAGFTPVDLGIARDTPEAIGAALQRGLREADMVLSSGGVSMGEKDYLKPCIEAVGGTIHFGRVEMKPGKPTTFATVPGGAGKAIFGLPGNPVSCLVCFHLFCLPALRKMAGLPLPRWHHPVVGVTLTGERELKLDPERPEYHRVQVRFCARTQRLVAASTGGQISSRLLSMHGANGFLRLPKGSAAQPTARPHQQYDCVLFGAL